jgi:hypothetical protein
VTIQTPALLHLRIIVLSLGEAQHDGWWRSKFLSPTGLSFLERLYPRSAFVAAVRSATRVACQYHDETIGQGNVSHLLRLFPTQERLLEQQLSTLADELAATFLPLLNDRMALMAQLAELAHGFATVAQFGPVRLRPENGKYPVSKMAALYHGAFHANKPVFPYCENKSAPT